MLANLRQVRPSERRDAFVAAATLFALMAAHALLETARDALFLASIPASRLPLVYIGVAAAAWVVSAVQDRGRGGPKALVAWLVLSALVTIGFQPLLERGAWVFYALYIWSAVVVTVALARFFLLLGARYTTSQAKRIYAVVGAGSVTGAIAGSGIASVLSVTLPPAQLLWVAAGALLLAAVGPMLLTPVPTASKQSEAETPVSGLAGHARKVWSHAYGRRVAILLILATVVFTLVDFVFKSEVAARVEPQALGLFFARLYFVLNVLSLTAQLLVVRYSVRVAGPAVALALLPLLIALGGVGVVLGGGFAAVLVLKGADGSLRHSLHRTASELLFVPMGDRLRLSAKTFIDIVGHRSAQALTSIAILGATAIGVTNLHLGAAIALLAGAATYLSFELRRHYLDVFRTTLSNAAERERFAFPELTLGTLESLLQTLNDPDPARVRTALQLFGEQDRAHLIPGLILYHPSPEVLPVALDLLAQAGRAEFVPLVDRLLDHEYADVRAAALRARLAMHSDEAILRERLDVSCPVVRATALVGLTAGGYASIEETAPALSDLVDTGSPIAREALARAIGYAPIDGLHPWLERLASTDDEAVLVSVVRSMGQTPRQHFVPALLRMLGRRRLRTQVWETLVAIGEPALAALDAALADGSMPRTIRLHAPAAVARFSPERAVPILQAHLLDADGPQRYKVLRALNRVVGANPGIGLDHAAIEQALAHTVAGAYANIDWRLALERGAIADPRRRTDAHRLIARMLRDKESKSIERVFRMLGLLAPNQQVQTIFRGLSLDDPKVRSSSRELLESFVRTRFRGAVLGLVDDVPMAERLLASSSFYTPVEWSYDNALEAMASGPSESLATLASYHARELPRVDPSREAKASPRMRASDSLVNVAQQAASYISPPEPEGAT
ncbi:MAG: AAA family ATP:ADP antiporter [Bradymonadia bacterium]|jgi:AAA family ATP:ADP antiporter